jgi:hypothetical protein
MFIFSFFLAAFSYSQETDMARVEYTYIPQVNSKCSTNTKRPFTLPILNYYRKFKPDRSYSLGTPKSNLKYFIQKKHVIQLDATLGGLFSNIQKNRMITYLDGSMAVAENISMTMVLGGL